MGLQLIRVLEYFVALGAFGLVLCEVFADGPGAQEAFVFSRRLLPSLLHFGLQIDHLLVTFSSFCSAPCMNLVHLFF